MQVLYSSKSIMELYRADKWPALQRVSHCSAPDDSWSLAAISVACERLSMQIADLSRDPILILRSKVSSPECPWHCGALLFEACAPMPA